MASKTYERMAQVATALNDELSKLTRVEDKDIVGPTLNIAELVNDRQHNSIRNLLKGITIFEFDPIGVEYFWVYSEHDFVVHLARTLFHAARSPVLTWSSGEHALLADVKHMVDAHMQMVAAQLNVVSRPRLDLVPGNDGIDFIGEWRYEAGQVRCEFWFIDPSGIKPLELFATSKTLIEAQGTSSFVYDLMRYGIRIAQTVRALRNRGCPELMHAISQLLTAPTQQAQQEEKIDDDTTH